MLTLTPIGTVRNEIKTPLLQGWGEVVSDLVLDEGYTEGLDGIEDYSHVIVIFWMDQAGAPKSLKAMYRVARICLLPGFLLDVDHPVPIPSVLPPSRFFVVRRTSYGFGEWTRWRGQRVESGVRSVPLTSHSAITTLRTNLIEALTSYDLTLFR